jgi:DNA-binding winged helix-turn-helix (wHTH) protein/predicted ATPase
MSAIEFAPFRLDLAGERLWRETQPIELRPKAFAVLCYLLENAGRLVTKEELLNTVWPEIAVGDAVLKVRIRELREALADDAKTPRFIETVHRRGYRFIAPLGPVPPQVSGSRFLVSGPEHMRQKVTERSSQRETRNEKPETTLVGREVELARLEKLFGRALEGHCQIVFVTGEAGIGKTTLGEALLAQVESESMVWSARGQCIEHYGSGEAYLPFLEVLTRLCRRPEKDRIVTLLHHYAPTWLTQLPSLLTGPEREALQRQALGASQQRMLREMADFLAALTVQAPLVFILEDLQWSDASTLDLLSLLASRKEPLRLLLVCTYRPIDVILSRHPLKNVKLELQGRGQCEEIALELLTEPDVERYVLTKFAGDTFHLDSLRELVLFVHQRTDGNPLFMTALVESLLARQLFIRDNGEWKLQPEFSTAKNEVPENIRQMIERQGEQLSKGERRVLGAASIAGAEFSTAEIAAALEEDSDMIEEHCESLARRQQFLRPLGLSEWPDGTVAVRYGFLHALYQNVLAESIGPGRQLLLHRRIGEREEAAYGSRVEEIASRLALHFELGRDDRRAVQYLQLSATNAKRRSAPREAIHSLTKALQLLQSWPEGGERLGQELSLQLALGPALMATHGYASVEVERAFVRAREICQQLGSTPLLFPALWGVWAFHVVRGELKPARELAEECFTLAQETQDPDLLIEAHHALWVTLFFSGKFAESLTHIEQGLALYTPAHQTFIAISGQDAAVAGLSYRAVALGFLGYHEQALHASQQALVHAQGLGHSFSVGFAMQFAAWTHFCRGDSKAGRAQAEALITFSSAQGFPFWLAGGLHFHAWALAEQGRLEEGLALARQGLDAWQATGAKLGLLSHLATFAHLCARAGRLEEAFSVLAQAFAFMEQTSQRYYEAELYRLKGEILLAQANASR